MKWKKLVLVALAVTMAIGAAGCGSQQKADSGKGAAVSGSITGSGSSALLPLVKDAAEKFKANNKDVTITLNAGGSGTGLKHAKEFIRENYADSGISLHMVAAEVGFSPNHFSTVFSQETGQTFVEYLTAVRIEAAKHLLTKGNSRMSDIAFDVGYQDSHYFSYLFKKHVGVSPREYRSRSEEG